MKANSTCVVITGGTGKLGRLFVAGFVDRGDTVCFTSRSQEKIDELLLSLPPRLSGRAIGVVSELGRPGSVTQLLEQVRALDLRPGYLINSARNAEFLRLDPQGRPSAEDWVGEFSLDVVVPYELSMALVHQSESELKGIVNIASMYGVVAATPSLYDDPVRESPIHYGVAKAALIHLTRELAVRLAPLKVRVNAISYGGVSGRAGKDFLLRYAKLTPSGTMLNEEDVFGPAAFLASDASSGMTGHNLVVDGGWTIW